MDTVFDKIPAILNVGSFENPAPRGLAQFAEILGHSYRIFEHPVLLNDYGIAWPVPLTNSTLLNRTIVERTISQANFFSAIEVDGMKLTLSGKGIEKSLTDLRTSWELLNEFSIKNTAEINAAGMHHLKIQISAKLVAILLNLVNDTEKLVAEVLKGYTIDKVKKSANNEEAYRFLIRWKADLTIKYDQFNETTLREVLKVVDSELNVIEKITAYKTASTLDKIVSDFLKRRDAQLSNNKLLRNLVSGDYEAFQNNLKELVLSLFSYHDLDKTEPEKIYHVFLLGVFNSFDTFYETTSNLEAGYGRFDIMLMPNDMDMPGMIIEVKRSPSDDEKDFQAQAQTALDQIEMKDYAVRFRTKGISSWVSFAAVFYGKNLYMDHKLGS